MQQLIIKKRCGTLKYWTLDLSLSSHEYLIHNLIKNQTHIADVTMQLLELCILFKKSLQLVLSPILGMKDILNIYWKDTMVKWSCSYTTVERFWLTLHVFWTGCVDISITDSQVTFIVLKLSISLPTCLNGISGVSDPIDR